MLRKLEKYEIEEEIGHGGMATVYRAHDTELDRLVALKVLHPHLRGAEEARRRFQREARSVARLRHPRVLEIYDFSGEGSAEAYIAAELLTGPTLKHWREATRDVPAEIAACMVIEIASALEAAHAAGIVHRDVKPENVLLHEDRTLKLTDFGIADMVDAASMTATGQILGSPGHMAPEQIEGRDTDPRTDLFALGTVLYYLSTGRLPFTGRNPHQILKRIVDGEYPDPLRMNPTIGGKLREIIIRSLAVDIDERHQSATELREELEAFVAEAEIDDPPAMLERFLKDPDGVREELKETTVRCLTERGARASDVGDVPTALDYYNRVLALDDGNEKVLKLIERVGMDRRRRAALMSGGVLMVVGVLATGLAYGVWSEPAEPVAEIGPIGEGPTDDAGGLELDGALAAVLVDAGAEENDAALATGPESPGDAGPAPAIRTVPPAPSTVAVDVRSAHHNMTVQFDGEAARPFDELGVVRLSPGRHTVVLSPMSETRRQYRQTTRTIQIPRTSEYRLALGSPDLLPGRLIVNSEPGAQVRVLSGSSVRASGSEGELMFVEMHEPSESFRVEVTLGSRRSVGRVTVNAGDSAELTVTLPEPTPEP